MYGPNGIRLFLVAAPAAIIAAPLTAASAKGDTSPVTRARAPSQPRNMPTTPDSLTSPPADALRVQAGKREVERARQRGAEHGMGQEPRPARDGRGCGPEQDGAGGIAAEGEHLGQPAVPGVDEPERD
jgi:hypothetical protein